MKLVVPNLKPRNPLIAPAKFRKAGAHKVGSVRQHQQRELRAFMKETQ